MICEYSLRRVLIMAVTDKDIQKYKYLIYKIVKKFNNIQGLSTDNLIFFGEFGLYRALRKVKDKYNHQQTMSYLSKAIYRAIYRSVKRQLEWNTETVSLDDVIKDIEEPAINNVVYPEELNLDNQIDLKRFIKRLNTDEQKMFVAWLAGYTQQEIAPLFNTSQTTLGRRLRAVIEKYKEFIDG